MIIQDLPPEILKYYIFEYLTLEDRKNVRFVCKEWYDNCNPNARERMVIRRALSATKVADLQKTLENCKFAELKLEFQNVNMQLFDPSFWLKCGRKIIYLKLYKCRIGNYAVKYMIKTCINLQTLRLHILLERNNLAFCVFTTLEEFVSKNVVNKELKTLEIYWYNSDYTQTGNVLDALMPSRSKLEFWRRTLDALYQIFPNVMNFSSAHLLQTVFNMRNDPYQRRCNFSRNTFVYDKWKERLMPSIMSRIAFSIFSCDTSLMTLLLEALSSTRLTHFDLFMTDSIYQQNGDILMRNFVASHKELKSIRMEFVNGQQLAAEKSLLFYILDTCPNLNKFEFWFSTYITLDLLSPLELDVLCSQCQTKKMEYFSVNRLRAGITEPIIPDISMISYSPICQKLRVLSGTLLPLTLQNYTTLQHLTLDATTNEILQSIFQHLTGLKTLSVNVFVVFLCTDFGFTGHHQVLENGTVTAQSTGYSIKRLQNLERLKIGTDRCQFEDKRTISEFKLPKLQFFQCESALFYKFRREALIQIATGMPSLKTLIFTSMAGLSLFTKAHILELCRRSKSLYYIDLERTSLQNFRAKKLFETCPTLRYISGGYIREGYVTLQYDPYTKRINWSHRRLLRL